MTNAQRARFKAALETKRRDLVRGIQTKTVELGIGEGEHDPIDQVKSMNQRDEAAIILRSLSGTLSNIDISLRAVADGTYGICVECDEEIALKRLEAIPWASLCISCQETLERNELTDEPDAPSRLEMAPRPATRVAQHRVPSAAPRAA